MTPNLEASAIIAFEITQPLEGSGLRVLYLAKRVCYQLVGEDAIQVPMDLSKFMPALLSMINTKYALWSLGVAYVNWLMEELDYDKFNRTRLMPSLTVEVLSFLPIISIPTLFFCILVHGDI